MKAVAYIVERAMCEDRLTYFRDPDALKNTPLYKREELIAKPLREWHEDQGPVTWWKFPVKEPAWIGSPTDSDWLPGYYTHWTPHPAIPKDPKEPR